MEKKIGDVATLLGINASKLRYWDKKGLIRFVREDENNYRSFSFETILDICDIMFYRDLSIPINTIKELEQQDQNMLERALLENKDTLKRQIQDIKNMIQKIDIRIDAIHQFNRLNERGLKIVKWKSPPISKFDFKRSELVMKYLNAPNQSAVFYQENNYMAEIYAYFTDLGEVIYKEDLVEEKYIEGLYWIYSDENSSNIGEFLNKAKELELQPKEMIGQYLLTLGSVEKIDYYIGRLKVKGN